MTGYFNDDAVDGDTAPDELGREPYARHALALLGRVREQTESGVMALIGPWGSGKSSVLQMMTRLLRTEHDGRWATAELNPWMYSDVESLTAALFSEIRAALPEGAAWSETRKRIADLGRKVAPIGKLASVLGLDVEGLINAGSDAVGGDQSTSTVRRKVEDALRKGDLPILVVVDDLDRLTPDELLVVCKLVRSVGRLPNIYYLLCYDEQTLVDVLRRSAMVGGRETRAREYLEKMVQVRLDLPAFRERDAVAAFDTGLRTICGAYGKMLDGSQMARLSETYYFHMQDRLLTPRSIKRFFGQVDAALITVADDVDLVDFLVVTFLRTMEPGVYELIKRHRAELTGTDLKLTFRAGDQLGIWRSRLSAAGVADDHQEGVLALLGQLFPADAALRGTGGSARGRSYGIGDSDYFDRYVMFAVPDDDLSEAALALAVHQIGAGVDGAERHELIERLRSDTHRTTRRLRRMASSDPSFPSSGLLLILADLNGQLTAGAEVFGFLSPDTALRVLAFDLLRALPDGRRAEVITGMAASPHGAHLAALLTRNLDQGDTTDGAAAEPPADIADCRAAAAMGIARHLPDIGTALADLSDEHANLLSLWRHLDTAAARAWVLQQLGNGWNLLDLLTTLTLPTHTMGAGGESIVLGPVDLGLFDALVGLDRIHEELAVQVDAADPGFQPSLFAPDEQDLRRQAVLSQLRADRNHASSRETPL